MMMAGKYPRIVLFGLLAAAFLTGCETPEGNLEPTLTTFSREQLERRKIQLPANYSTQNFRKMCLGVAFETLGGVDKKTGAPLAIDKDLSARLQTEMAKLKRFTVFSAHNEAGVMTFKALEDVDKSVKLQKTDSAPTIDYILNARVTVTKERQDRYNDVLIIYEVECDFNCEELKTRTVKFAEKAKGRTARKQIFSITGQAIAGYQETEEKQAITQAAMKALAMVANKLGNTFPVGGRVTACTSSGTRMTIDKGFEDGIGKNQQCVVFVNDGGVDVPIALAEAAPSTDSSNLEIYRWNYPDNDASILIKQFRANPRDFLNSNKAYAVGYGMPVPPEWENAYNDSMDEQLRLGK